MLLQQIDGGTVGLKPYSKYDAFTEYKIHNIKGFFIRKAPMYYQTETRMTFRRPKNNCFYMSILRKLSNNIPRNLYELGVKEHTKFGRLIRHNTDIITAMKNAGMIEKVGSGHDTKWKITEMGLKYFNSNNTDYIKKYFS